MWKNWKAVPFSYFQRSSFCFTYSDVNHSRSDMWPSFPIVKYQMALQGGCIASTKLLFSEYINTYFFVILWTYLTCFTQSLCFPNSVLKVSLIEIRVSIWELILGLKKLFFSYLPFQVLLGLLFVYMGESILISIFEASSFLESGTVWLLLLIVIFSLACLFYINRVDKERELRKQEYVSILKNRVAQRRVKTVVEYVKAI